MEVNVLCFFSVVQSGCSGVIIPDVQLQEGQSWTGNFKIPRIEFAARVASMDAASATKFAGQYFFSK